MNTDLRRSVAQVFGMAISSQRVSRNLIWNRGEIMKKFFSIIATGSLLTLMAVAAHAQLPGAAIRASIPFDFNVRGRTLPAGHYEIWRINDEPGGLIIRNVDLKR